PGDEIALALDAASSEFFDKKGNYVFKKSDKSVKSAADMVQLYAEWVKKYPIVSIEDGLAEDDWDGWQILTRELGKKVQLVGDDLFVTNTERIAWRSTTSCCESPRNWAIPVRMRVGMF